MAFLSHSSYDMPGLAPLMLLCLFLVYCGCDTSYIVSVHIRYARACSSYYVIMPFSGVLWLWHFLYSVGPHPMSSLHIYTFVVSLAFMAGTASQAKDADSSRVHGLHSGFQGSVNFHRGALLSVPQWRCISSFFLLICFILRAVRLSFKILGQECVGERLKSSLRKFYGRCGDLIKHHEVSLSQMLYAISGYDHIRWYLQLIRHYTNLCTYYRTRPHYRLWPYY